MRVLFYNWVQFDDWYLRGGGVTVYLQNTIKELKKIDNSIEIYFLSSGHYYDLLNKKIRVEKTDNAFKDLGVKSFRIVNSPIKAPAHDAFCSLEKAFYNEELKDTLSDFLKRNGPFDIFHIHNVEGLTLDIFSLKKEFPELKFIFTAHNYHIMCPQIELFKNRREICHNYHEGMDCINCIGHHPNMETLKKYQSIGSKIEQYKLDSRPLGNFIFMTARNLWSIYKSTKWILHYTKNLFKEGIFKAKPQKNKNINIYQLENVIKRKADLSKGAPYVFWRDLGIKNINQYVDKVISVSKQTEDIFRSYGIENKKLITIHNGMDHFSDLDDAKKRWDLKKNSTIRLGFFGYPTPAKGFDLFLKALELLPRDILKRIEITVASRLDNHHKEKLVTLKNKVKSIYIVEGYEREMIPELMNSITLAVVPSLWLETYCQVAAELVAFGTPVILSDTVGFKDFYLSNDFIFKSGDAKALSLLLNKYLSEPKLLDTFWDQIKMPPSAKEHAENLLTKVYLGR